MTVSATPKLPRPKAIDWAAGAALGLLLGLLVGLSASPVVSSVVVGLVALLAGVFGLSDKLPLGLGEAGAHRLTAFALTASLAVLAGLTLRSHSLLAPDVTELRRQIAEIGVTDPTEQRQLLRFLRFGLAPDGVKPAGDAAKALQPVLYSEGTSFCARLRGQVRAGAGPADLLAVLATGSEAARRLADDLAALPEPERLGAARAAPHYLCAP